jgi:YidC/Oxa1 family membrane protein insertase
VIYWAWNNTLSVIQQAAIMHRQGVEIPLLENLGFKAAVNGRKASEAEPADSEPKPAKPAKKRAKSAAPAANPESGETQSEPKS